MYTSAYWLITWCQPREKTKVVVVLVFFNLDPILLSILVGKTVELRENFKKHKIVGFKQ